MTKLVLVEGPDNVGKTTFINRMIARKGMERKKIIKWHFSKPAPGQSPIDRYVPTLKQQLSLEPDLIFWDRGPLSAYIYEGYYRKALYWGDVETVLQTMQKLVELEVDVLLRSWEKVKHAHMAELVAGVEDPNGATKIDRELIHYQWEDSVARFQVYANIVNQEW